MSAVQEVRSEDTKVTKSDSFIKITHIQFLFYLLHKKREEVVVVQRIAF